MNRSAVTTGLSCIVIAGAFLIVGFMQPPADNSPVRSINSSVILIGLVLGFSVLIYGMFTGDDE